MFHRGHMAAKADFFYHIEQMSTYFYGNVLPMWKSINGGNWGRMEDEVRRLAARKQSNLQVWTGGLGVLQLSNVDIYLAQQKVETVGPTGRREISYRPAIPAPKLLWKLVICHATNEAIAFLVANNPYVANWAEIQADYMICPEYTPCRASSADFSSIERGVLYCCLYRDFIDSMARHHVDLPVYMDNPGPLV